MGLGKAMIVAGIGCRKGVKAAEVQAAIATALDRAGLAANQVDTIATSAAKNSEAGIAAAASTLGAALVLVAQRDLEAAGARTVTKSERALAVAGVPSLAEAAALAAAGAAAQLLLPRLAVGAVTCALATTGDDR
jgi:cobalt-precorrin 5A hydrolase